MSAECPVCGGPVESTGMSHEVNGITRYGGLCDTPGCDVTLSSHTRTGPWVTNQMREGRGDDG